MKNKVMELLKEGKAEVVYDFNGEEFNKFKSIEIAQELEMAIEEETEGEILVDYGFFEYYMEYEFVGENTLKVSSGTHNSDLEVYLLYFDGERFIKIETVDVIYENPVEKLTTEVKEEVVEETTENIDPINLDLSMMELDMEITETIKFLKQLKRNKLDTITTIDSNGELIQKDKMEVYKDTSEQLIAKLMKMDNFQDVLDKYNS